MNTLNKRKSYGFLLKIFFMILGTIILILIFIILILLAKTKPYIYKSLTSLPATETCLVLGAAVYRNGKLSGILEDRLVSAVKLYESGKIKTILLSGDHRKASYDEVLAMDKFILHKGIPRKHIIVDYNGFSTFESIFRAKYVYNKNELIICTQDFHLPRALYIAHSLDINAAGYVSNIRTYPKQRYFEYREVLATIKAFLDIISNRKQRLDTSTQTNRLK